MARIIWPMTPAVRLAALAAGRGDGTAAKVAEGENRAQAERSRVVEAEREESWSRWGLNS